jgi:exodeoxyribonuclease V alpha subunit
LKDVLSLQQADHHRLTQTHRNSGGILDVVEQVRHGQIDCVNRPGVTFSNGLSEPEVGFSSIAAKYSTAVQKYGYEHVALIMSRRAGDPETPGWNTTYSNHVLRNMCNPNAIKVPGTRLYVGDRIIIRENMNVVDANAGMNIGANSGSKRKDDLDGMLDNDKDDTVRVVNGDTGTILSFQKSYGPSKSMMPSSLCLKLDDGRTVYFPGSETNVLQHAYALTVHSAQGSEYKKVIAVITPGQASFMNRSMLFTGLSRARNELDINGENAAIRRVASTPLPPRNSALVERFNQKLKSFNDSYLDLDGDDKYKTDEKKDLSDHQLVFRY